MVELAEIFRIYGPPYQARFGDSMLPNHLKAMQAMEACRTEALGGHVYFCEKCGENHYSYHSCKNRHCRDGSPLFESLRLVESAIFPLRKGG
ncbi:MAG: transposase zinc-binding domain-containing protein [Candidatus Desantisbacteria bacterium]